MINRRNFLRTMIGGVAAAAAVRAWPFRSYSFPSHLRKLPMDLGFNVFDYAGIPIIEDFELSGGQIYLLNKSIIVANPNAHCKLIGLETPPDWSKKYLEGEWNLDA